MPSPYPVHTVERYDRATRRTLETLASGLSMRSASLLASEVRRSDRANGDRVGYRVGTLPLDEQAALLAAGETMTALRLAA